MVLPVETLQEDPGAAPGIELDEISAHHPSTGNALITCYDFCPSTYTMQEINDLGDFLARHRPEWSTVRWINVIGLGDLHAIHALATKYDLHPLAIEDLIHINQRPKVETYGGEETEMLARLFIVAHYPDFQARRLKQRQVSIFLGHKTVLTFQEAAVLTPGLEAPKGEPNSLASNQASGDVWDGICLRIKSKGSRLRRSDASFLAYSLLDALVDRCFPILEAFSDRVEELESLILDDAQRGSIGAIHEFKRDLLLLRWGVWPLREVIANLQRDEHECVSDTTRIYLRDLYDHVIQIIEIIETYRETASDLTETYMTSISNRMNEVMKVLTLIGTIFIPLTFLAGVYGMNFHFFPELDQPWAYPVFWLVCVLLALAMIAFFKRRNWL